MEGLLRGCKRGFLVWGLAMVMMDRMNHGIMNG